MKIRNIVLLYLLIAGHWLPSSVYAGTPQRITWQGTLRKAGAIYTGTVLMEFKITNADGSAVYWTSGSTGVYVSAGLFRYSLGTPNEAQFAAIPWAAVSPYVRVTLDGAALPADQLLSTPYALHSGTAESSAGSFILADGDLRISTTTGSRGIVFQDGSAQYTAASSGLWMSLGADIYNSNAGNVGIGTTGPTHKLAVSGGMLATSTITAQGGFYGDGANLTNVPVAASINVSTINATAMTLYGGVNVTTNTFIQGNMGIGTTNPSEKLEVAENGKKSFEVRPDTNYVSLLIDGIEVARIRP